MSFQIVNDSIFNTPADAFVNSINCVGVMGAGIALEFKKKYPLMFEEYRNQCNRKRIRPGGCMTYFDEANDVFILNLAVKDDWKSWSTLEWIEQSISSLKLAILENDIKSVNLPVLGGMNGRRGPNGKIPNMTPAPDKDEIVKILETSLTPFSEKFNIEINLCLPENKIVKTQPTLESFLEV